jgi:hypothetical protein
MLPYGLYFEIAKVVVIPGLIFFAFTIINIILSIIHFKNLSIIQKWGILLWIILLALPVVAIYNDKFADVILNYLFKLFTY